MAVLFTKTYGRILAPGLSALDPDLPEEVTARSSLSTAWRCFEKALDDFMQAALAQRVYGGGPDGVEDVE